MTFADRQKLSHPDYVDPHEIRPIPMARNLANIWARYPQYSEENTLMVSNFYNEIEDFQRNDVIIPEFDPKLGRTDFHDDVHLSYVQ